MRSSPSSIEPPGPAGDRAPRASSGSESSEPPSDWASAGRRRVTERSDKTLSIEGDGPTPGRVEARVRLAARSLELRCRASAPALPFFDGAFDDATLRCPRSWFDREAAGRAAREIERVVRP